MAGHSQFKNIMHRKGRQDSKRSRVFSRLSREITVAARIGGGDPDSNPRLRLAIQEARGQNMPKDNIERAIQKSVGGTADAYEEICYEGYGPSGVGFIVEAMTDNRNRTVASVRARFDRSGGALAEGGAVRFQFERTGEVILDAGQVEEEALLDAAVEAGATDTESDAEFHRVYCPAPDLAEVSRRIGELLGVDPVSAKLIWAPSHTVAVAGEDAERVLRLFHSLNDDDDVQEVFTNFELPDELLEHAAA